MSAIVIVAPTIHHYQRVAEMVGRDARVRRYFPGAFKGLFKPLVLFVAGWDVDLTPEQRTATLQECRIADPLNVFKEVDLVDLR